MTTLAQVANAILHSDGSSWEVADAVAGLPESDRDGPLTLDRVCRYIYEATGTEWSPNTLSWYRTTAEAFPIDTRVSHASFRAHVELRAHPEKLRRWKPTKSRPILTVEAARALRGRSGAAKPKADAWKADLKRALVLIDRCTEQEPAFVLDMLEQTCVMIRRKYRKQLAAHGLRAV